MQGKMASSALSPVCQLKCWLCFIVFTLVGIKMVIENVHSVVKQHELDIHLACGFSALKVQWLIKIIPKITLISIAITC